MVLKLLQPHLLPMIVEGLWSHSLESKSEEKELMAHGSKTIILYWPLPHIQDHRHRIKSFTIVPKIGSSFRKNTVSFATKWLYNYTNYIYLTYVLHCWMAGSRRAKFTGNSRRHHAMHDTTRVMHRVVSKRWNFEKPSGAPLPSCSGCLFHLCSACCLHNCTSAPKVPSPQPRQI